MTLYIGPIDWLCRYLANTCPPITDITRDPSPWTVVPIHPAQVTWIGDLRP